MKRAVFVLGFLMGVFAAYLVLSRVWSPDVRQEQARPSPLPTPLTTPPTLPFEATPDPALAPIPWPSSGTAVWPNAPTAAEAPAIAPRETLSTTLPILETDLDRLRRRALLVPVQGMQRKALRDTFGDARGGGRHQAIDILAPRGTPVLAVDDGRIEKLFTSKRGGLTLYQFDLKGEYCYYYAHLDRYAPSVEAGLLLHKGDVIGYVGSTGNASPDAPHLHFTIFRLGAEKKWWQGTAINAYTLWKDTARP